MADLESGEEGEALQEAKLTENVHAGKNPRQEVGSAKDAAEEVGKEGAHAEEEEDKAAARKKGDRNEENDGDGDGDGGDNGRDDDDGDGDHGHDDGNAHDHGAIGDGVKQESTRKRTKEATLGPRHFTSSKDMYNYFFDLLQGWPPNVNINKYEHMMLEDLIKKGHQKSEEKIGAGIEAFQVRVNPEFYSRCYYVIRKDGSMEDFSYRKCVDNILALPSNMKANTSTSNLKRKAESGYKGQHDNKGRGGRFGGRRGGGGHVGGRGNRGHGGGRF